VLKFVKKHRSYSPKKWHVFMATVWDIFYRVSTTPGNLLEFN